MSVAIVTGGSSGMGLEIAKKLKEDGYEVTVLDLSPPPLSGLAYMKTDIRSSKEVEHAAEKITTLDLLVNNAGIYFEEYLESTTDDQLDLMVDVNIKGTYRVSRTFIPKLIKAGDRSLRSPPA